jgi:hypothetical protein
MNWLKKLFAKEANEDTGASEISVRVAEIQTRIAAIRSRNGWDQEPYKNSKAQPQHVVAEEKHPLKNKSQEMDALKAKLLGKKL